ncbi:O-antigen polymerase family protein [Oleiphilus messinensis]|uniref:O-antigen polymerase family protein n=1 Tax=Oleiphilus messinensis TaxID=141451 RepID=A0A1Y0I6Q5_9GAMM|nr:O-antigen polymerase family protein [Oleiphilus messinensis]
MLTWCWVSYMVPHKLAWGFARDFPVALIIAAAFLVSFFITKEKRSIPLSSVVVGLILFNLWIVVVTLVTPGSPYEAMQFEKVFKIQLFTFLSLALINSEKRINQFVAVIALSISFYGIKGGIFTITSGGGERVWGPPGGFFEGNNELALTLLMALPLMFYLIQITQNKWLKRALYAGIALTAVAAIGTHSRGAMLAACSVLFILWLRSRRKVIALVIALVAVTTVVSFMPQHWHDRMASTFQSKEEDYDTSAQGRINAWRFAYNYAQDNLFGGGFDSFTPANFFIYAPDPYMFQDAHSIYFQVLGNFGFFGLFLFLLLGVLSWLKAGSTVKLAKKHPEIKWAGELSKMLQCSLVAYAVGGAFLGLAYFDLPYHLMILIAAINTVASKQLADKAADSPTKIINETGVQKLRRGQRSSGAPG